MGKRLGIRVLLHSAGLGCVFGSVVITLRMLVRIATQGVFIAEEPDSLILYIEIVANVFALVYSLYLVKRFIGEKK